MKPPHGFLPLTPYFTVEDADALIRFCKVVFGARILKDSRYEDGTVRCPPQINDSLIMLNRETKQFTATFSQMHLYVDDGRHLSSGFARRGDQPDGPDAAPHGDQMALC